jgi:hypothetical protein
MFEEYLQDAYGFLESAKKAGNERDARRYYRASTFYISGAMEAFVNYIAQSFAEAGKLNPHEIAFLNDKVLTFSPEKVQLVDKLEFHRIEDKLKVLIRRFLPKIDLGKKTWWGELQKFKDFRDSLVHPKKSDDETQISEYDQKVSSGLKATIQGMNEISRGVYGKPLRKKLLDLIPE